MKKDKLEIINLSGSSLTSLAKKGNLSYAEQLYNPLNFFDTVHHISFDQNDRNIKLTNPTIEVHILKTVLSGVPVVRWIINSPLALIQVCRIARKNKVCLIRGRNPYHASLLGLIASRLLRIPFVVSIGGNHRLAHQLMGRYAFNSRFLSEREEEIVLKGADRVICPNQYSREYVISLGVSPGKACIIPLRLEDDTFNFTYQESDILSSKGVDINKPIILFVGKFESDKQVESLIETIPLVTRDCPEVQFALIGDGSIKAAMERKVVELGQERNVYFLGFQSTETIRHCLSAATAVCVTMSGFVILEAAAASKAIIAFDVEWHSEFIRDGETGLLVENRNRDKLAEAIKGLVNSPELANSLGKNARGLLEVNFNPRRIGEVEIAELLKVIHKNEPDSQK